MPLPQHQLIILETLIQIPHSTSNMKKYHQVEEKIYTQPIDNNSERCQLSELEKILHTHLITNIDELFQRLELSLTTNKEHLLKVIQNYPLRIPESILDRINKNDLEDPILKQFLPDPKELIKTPGFSEDPLCENQVIQLHKNLFPFETPTFILQKYSHRILFITTNECAARCRFCFRRHLHNTTLFSIAKKYRQMHDNAGQQSEKELCSIQNYLDNIFASIQKNPAIHEIIFSGGDPLTLSNCHLKMLLNSIKKVNSVNRVRFHTRIPILVPERIDATFPSWYDTEEEHGQKFALYLTVHVNTPNEINNKVVDALFKLRKRGYILTSQTTLLRGINDSAEVLVELFEKLVNCGVIPYYLHQFDLVQGAAHFETPIETGLSLMKKIPEYLSGYAVPKFVREIPGRNSKVNLLLEPNATVKF